MMTNFDSSNVRGEVSINTSLSRFNTWSVGGKAECLFQPADLEDLSEFLANTDPELSITWLGLGSNVLIRDGGIAGIVIITQGCLKEFAFEDNNVVYAQAGMACAKLARTSVSHGLSGLEFMAGIPGTVGGALAMNAGAFGGQTWGRVASVDVISRNGIIQTRAVSEYEVDYRSVKQEENEWFVAGRFALNKKSDDDKVIPIKELLEKRSATQPIGKKNCGSVFKNPSQAYAAQLIEKCGLKGFSIGGACVSEKHANFIINEQDASASDIEDLIEHIQQTVLTQCGIDLELEVKIIGEKINE